MSNIDNKTYLENFKKMKEYRDVFLDHLNVFSKLDGFGKIMADEFERMNMHIQRTRHIWKIHT